MLGVVSLKVCVRGGLPGGVCKGWSPWRCVLGVRGGLPGPVVCVRGGLPGGMC